MKLHLVRDLLDKELIDRDDCTMGRVDGLVMEIPENRQPRIVAIQVGGPVLAARIGKWAVKPAKWLEGLWGPNRHTPVSIPYSKVTKLGRDVHVDMIGEESDAMIWEKWLAKNLIGKIPGSE